MRRIYIPKHKAYVTIDDVDYDFVRQFTLCLSGGTTANPYPYAYKPGMEDPVPLHRLIAKRAGISARQEIDHRNRRKQDCRRGNLRPATRTQNFANRPKYRNNTSGYKGVIWSEQKRKWQARLIKDRVQHHLGFFTSAKIAHRAYVQAAKEHFGEFACP
jgi:hypothetical protein